MKITPNQFSSTNNVMAIINRDVVPIILLLFVSTRYIDARCCRGRKPEFVLGPIVANVSPTLVSVSWLGSIIPRDWADEFEIFYWKTNSEKRSFHKKLSNQKDGKVLVSVYSDTIYTFQVKAKEISSGLLCWSSEVWSSEISIKTMEPCKRPF